MCSIKRNLLFAIIVAGSQLTACRTVEKAVLSVGQATGNETMIKATADLTPRQEHYLGRSIMARILTQSPPVRTDEVQSYVNQLGQYLALHSTRPVLFNGYRFVVVNDEAPTALSAPGGFVAMSHSMLQLLKSEDELAAVLAHEIAHIALKHAEENIKSSNRAELGRRIFQIAADANQLAEGALVFSDAIAAGFNLKFNQDQEMEADAKALVILRRAGYSPTALYKALNRIPSNTNFLSSHPRTTDRLASIRTRLQGDKVFFTKSAQNRFVEIRSQVSKKKPSI
ncbi:MAG: hypothetical protein RL189_344 [Pseudomonadota bacterium]|jgi:predicted Zn-dependent protease